VIPERGFSLAVLRVEGRLRLQQGFTSDRKVLEQAVATATEAGAPGQASPFDLQEKELIAVVQTGADPSGKPVSASDRILAQTLFSALQESGQLLQNQHAQPYLSGLLALVQSQKQLAQRKAVIYFTHSRQLDSHAKDMIESIVGEANRDGVSIYVIDLNALDQKAHEEFAANVSSIGSIPGTCKAQQACRAYLLLLRCSRMTPVPCEIRETILWTTARFRIWRRIREEVTSAAKIVCASLWPG